jgi:adenine-specific DNA-methyltransferase
MQRHQALLLNLLPQDCSAVGNQTLLQRFVEACNAEGLAATEAEFLAAREALLGAGLVVKGRGRGGATARATGGSRPDFELASPAITPALTSSSPKPKPATQTAPKPSGASTQHEPQVISYRHHDRRVNNPEVGLVNTESDPEQPKTVWSYDPHLDPALQFDSARAQAEKVVDEALALGADHAEQQRNEVLAWLDHALAGQDMAAMREVVTNLRQRLAKSSGPSPEREALEAIKRMSAPYLQWTGKAERTSFDVDTVSLHVHERIDAMSILSAVSKRQGKKADKAPSGGFQPGLFEAPFESVPLRTALDFYKHDRGWANRLVAGDSLLVMNSLLKKEGMAGQVQMIYIDPPYGIKYGSNFQPFVGKRDVKDRSDADLTQEPEMIKAFRDTWELGIHSYLTYLRDRLLLALPAP